MSTREVLAYAITHAPRGVKGGPYTHVASLGRATKTYPPDMVAHVKADIGRWLPTPAGHKAAQRFAPKAGPHARVIRIVRKARPSPSSGQEASAVEVLRELVDSLSSREGLNLSDLASRARRVLASSPEAGPDPSEVVRAAMAETEAEEALRVSVAAKNSAPGIGPRWQAAVDAWLAASKRLNAARAERRVAVDAYRKAGGTP